jgi:Asp-tRNA(Asn)/Glu-tRNA(Gln) amidotransferase A subunit family amidase
MFTKLTLNISKGVIEQAKKTARKRKTSISRLVEEYLKKISHEEEDLVVSYMIKNAPAVKTPVGEEKKILKKRLLKKYGS